MNRDIRSAKFAWTEKWAWKQIESLDFKKQASCKLIYTALCIASSMQMNSPKIKVYKFDLARFASVSEKTVQRYLPELEDLGIISMSPQDRKSNGKFEKVSIWLKQGLPAVGHLEDRSETDQRQMEDTESDNNINIITEEKKKERKKEITHSNKFEEELFEKFWNVYGKKRGRKICIEIWKKKKIDLELANKIINSANEYASVTDVKFRKDPERWLRDERWEDSFGDLDLPIFSERTIEQHAREYASYPENAMPTFRRKYKDELPPKELHKLAMKLEDIVYP